MSHTQPDRPAIYGRVSSERQSEAGTIDSQIEDLRQRVRQDQLHLDEDLCFIDDGYSGSTLNAEIRGPKGDDN
jgi:site-specific DNA recombinase